MRSITTRGLVLAALALTTACRGDGGTEPKPQPSGFTATVSGATSASLSGTAGFAATGQGFVLDLVNKDANGPMISFVRVGALPATGTYTFSAVPQAGEIVGLYATGGATPAGYASTGGTLTITVSSNDRLKGSFSFTATGGSTGAATISVTGSFDAARVSMPQ